MLDILSKCGILLKQKQIVNKSLTFIQHKYDNKKI